MPDLDLEFTHVERCPTCGLDVAAGTEHGQIRKRRNADRRYFDLALTVFGWLGWWEKRCQCECPACLEIRGQLDSIRNQHEGKKAK
jgi:hypothetical protein